MLSSRNVLVVAPHPDDETLGAGGTLLRLADAGASLHWLLVTAAHADDYEPAYVDRQRQQVEAVRAAYPFEGFQWLELPASGLHRCDRGKLVDAIRAQVAEIRPETVFLPHLNDVHDDHAVTCAAGLAACKSFYMREMGVHRLLAMEIPSETDAAAPAAASAFVPTITVDISQQLQRKLEIFELYESEQQRGNKPRSPEALAAQARAHGATCDLGAGERFMLLREIVA